MKGILHGLALTTILSACASTQSVKEEPVEPYRPPTHTLTFTLNKHGDLIKNPQLPKETPEEAAERIRTRPHFGADDTQIPKYHETYTVSDCHDENLFGAHVYKKTRAEVDRATRGIAEHQLGIENTRQKERLPGAEHSTCILERPTNAPPVMTVRGIRVKVPNKSQVCYDSIFVYPNFEEPTYFALKRECSSGGSQLLINVDEFAIDRREEYGGSKQEYANRYCHTEFHAFGFFGTTYAAQQTQCNNGRKLEEERKGGLPPKKFILKEIVDANTLGVLGGKLQ